MSGRKGADFVPLPGDWVHITNPNDLTKPIVAQVYRTYIDKTGKPCINACWYYRPEQTVHRFEKHFFENEVVKTGQYRDHGIDEVSDRCFVMFITRYNKGRPRGLPKDKEIYVCEARYNEEKHKINKIKTWASCLPDEVREKDYEMDLFDVPRRLKKYPSPIKHLLRDDAKPDDPLPKPTWGALNAPPLVGAVHCRAREANVSCCLFGAFFCLSRSSFLGPRSPLPAFCLLPPLHTVHMHAHCLLRPLTLSVPLPLILAHAHAHPSPPFLP